MADHILEIQGIAHELLTGQRRVFPLIFPIPFGLRDIILIQKHVLSVAEIAIALPIEGNLALTQKHVLVIDEINNALLIDGNLDLTIVLSVDGVLHSVSIEGPLSIIQAHLLVINDILHSLTSEEINLALATGILGVEFDLNKPINIMTLNKPGSGIAIYKPITTYTLEGH